MEDVSQIRRNYKKSKLDISTVPESPYQFFDIWMKEALKSELLEPTAFILSTVSKDSKPSSRIVLLKEYDNNGFVFFTNYLSRKGNELSENENVAMLFFWDCLERQVRIEGKAERISYEESLKYFNSRSYTSRIGAWASKQSQVLNSRFTLMREVAKYMAKYKLEVPLPEFWGGIRIVPEAIEFWQGRESRLHDRIKYNLENGNWIINRLYP